MRGVCYTCLCQDRDVKVLDNVLIKSILWDWFDAGGRSNLKVNLDEFKLCWECIAWFLRIYKFRQQVFESQEIRMKFTQKTSTPLINLSKLSTHTKNTYDATYQHVEGSNYFNALKIKSRPADSSNNDLKVSKEKSEHKPDNGKRKIFFKFHNNNRKITLKRSRSSDYNSAEKKKKDIHKDLKQKDQNTEDKDRNESKKDTTRNDNGKIDFLSILTGRELYEDVKLRSQPYVLIKREIQTKEVLKHTKKKRRKRKHNATIAEFDETKAKINKTDATNVGPNAGMKKTTEDSSKELIPDLPEVKFTIVHLTEEQMLETREVDRNDRLYLNRAFKCQTCIIGFLEIKQCEKHYIEKHSELMGALVCPICCIRFKKHCFLELHQKTHYRSYRCRHCNFEHHRRYVIETHVVNEHELKPSPVCPDCDMEFDTQNLLVSHYEVAHKERLKCNICGQSFDTYARVKKHAATHKGATDNAVIVEIFHCACCKCNFEGKATYRTHMQFAHEDLAENAYCADCDIQFSGIHKYTQHLEESITHNLLEDLKFDCAHCSYKFLTKEALLAHIVRTHRLLSQTCALCNKVPVASLDLNCQKQRLNENVNLVVAPSTHVVASCYTASQIILCCSVICFKGFSDPPRLRNHIQAKHPEVIPVRTVKDKICPICSNGFFTRTDLFNHMRTHKAEKPYQCKKCEKRFVVKTLLKKHIQRTHQEEDK